MTQFVMVYDEATALGIKSTMTIPQLTFTITDYNFDVGTGGQSSFVVGQNFTSDQQISFYINGDLQEEGATKAWQRDVNTHSINTSETVHAGAWVLISIKA